MNELQLRLRRLKADGESSSTENENKLRQRHQDLNGSNTDQALNEDALRQRFRELNPTCIAHPVYDVEDDELNFLLTDDGKSSGPLYADAVVLPPAQVSSVEECVAAFLGPSSHTNGMNMKNATSGGCEGEDSVDALLEMLNDEGRLGGGTHQEVGGGYELHTQDDASAVRDVVEQALAESRLEAQCAEEARAKGLCPDLLGQLPTPPTHIRLVRPTSNNNQITAKKSVPLKQGGHGGGKKSASSDSEDNCDAGCVICNDDATIMCRDGECGAEDCSGHGYNLYCSRCSRLTHGKNGDYADHRPQALTRKKGVR